MAFVVPSMPIKFRGWRSYDPAVDAYAAPDIPMQDCNLSPGRRVFTVLTVKTYVLTSYKLYPFQMELLVPKLTDVRAGDDVSNPDVLEVPTGSGRLYEVVYVDDIGKGFANEHRLVVMSRFAEAAVFTDATIPVPQPLP